jgi:hypothetical protein
MTPSVKLRMMLESEPSPRYDNLLCKWRDDIKYTYIQKGIWIQFRQHPFMLVNQ